MASGVYGEIRILGLTHWLDLFHLEIETVANYEVLIEKVSTGTRDRLCCPGNHLEHFRCGISDYGSIVLE